MNMLYHVDLGFPLGFKYPDVVVPLEWGLHAQQQAQEDRYGRIDKMKILDTEEYTPIEVEINEKRAIVKMVLRSKKAYKGNNIVIVVMPGEPKWFVKTVWYNREGDTHATLDESKYLIPAFSIKKVLDKSY